MRQLDTSLDVTIAHGDGILTYSSHGESLFALANCSRCRPRASRLIMELLRETEPGVVPATERAPGSKGGSA